MKCLCFIVLLAIVIAQSYVGVEAAPSDGFGFRNGAIYRALQTAPGSYDEQTFQGLDFGIAEAKRVGIKLIIPLVNNWDDYGGKKQYVDWARSKGEMVSSNDDFYRNPVIKEFYKNHVKTMLNRVNTFTKVAYKDEPASMAWQLMNEPRCGVDRSGKTLMAWINEMALFVKSVDPNHLLSTGHEGFYGDSSPERKNSLNPVSANTVGADFIANHNIDAIDFASMHCGSDLWFQRLDQNSRLAFIKRWLEGHIEDAQNNLKKPVILAEFGLGSDTPRYTLANRDDVFTTTYDIIYDIYAKRRLGRGSIVLGGY
ncbi:(1-4)-beta-mannan endohydrolase-like protein [Arabidopsis thaliana]|nr:(1-4)-beta-mannan endohydrolase-like protein [Arabidopsis thaliana]